MHTLHRLDVPRAITVTVIAAVLAIFVTLALATGLNDLARAAAPSGTASTPPIAQPRAAGETWTMNPFARLLSAPVAVPWAPAEPRPSERP